MKIALISAISPLSKKPSGSKTFVLNTATELTKRGHEVLVVSSTEKSTNKKANFRVAEIRIRKEESTMSFLASLFVQANRLTLEQYEIVHFQGSNAALPLITPKESMIITLHGNPHATYRRTRRLVSEAAYSLAEIPGLLACRKVISTDQTTLSYYSRKYPWLLKKIITIPMGVNTDVFKPLDKGRARAEAGIAEESPIILYAGRLAPEKNLGTLIRAFNMVVSEHPDVSLFIVGQGKEYYNLMELANQLNLSKKVNFIEPVTQEYLALLMASADVFALPSLTESSPMVVREALSCGIPVVSMEVGDVSAIIKEGENGVLIEHNDPQTFARALSFCISNSLDMRQKCIKAAEPYRWSNIIDKLLEVYAEVAG